MNCPICKSTALKFLYQFINGPVMQNKLYDSLESSLRAKKARITLYGCRDCNFVFNVSFDSKK